MNSLTVTLEAPAKLRAEGEEMMIEHYREMGLPGDLCIDWPALGKLYRDGVMFSFGFRKNRKLIGYAVVMAQPALFNTRIKRGDGQALYLDPEHRGEGNLETLLFHVEGVLKHRGVSSLSWSVSPTEVGRGPKCETKVGELMAGFDYRLAAETWMKPLEG
jgi:GNAT superfamily N-acetyltransferase